MVSRGITWGLAHGQVLVAATSALIGAAVLEKAVRDAVPYMLVLVGVALGTATLFAAIARWERRGRLPPKPIRGAIGWLERRGLRVPPALRETELLRRAVDASVPPWLTVEQGRQVRFALWVEAEVQHAAALEPDDASHGWHRRRPSGCQSTSLASRSAGWPLGELD